MRARHEDDRAPTGIDASLEARERDPTGDRECGKELRCGGPEECPDPTRVTHEQQDPVDLTVSDLEIQAASERLGVAGHGLGLGAVPPVRPGKESVPGALVAGNREWHLGRPPKRGMEERGEVGEELDLGLVAQPRGTGVGLRGEIEADGRRDPKEDQQRHLRCQAALDPTDLGIREPDGGGDPVDAQPTGSPFRPELGAETMQRCPAKPGTAIDRTFSGGHGARLTPFDHPPITWHQVARSGPSPPGRPASGGILGT